MLLVFLGFLALGAWQVKRLFWKLDLIERVEGHPDTVITLTGDTKYVVAESVDAVLREIRDYRASVQAVAFRMDRGDYRAVSTAVSEDDDSSSVVPFPTREER